MKPLILGAVERDQQTPVEAAEHVQTAIDLPKLRDGFGEDGMLQRRDPGSGSSRRMSAKKRIPGFLRIPNFDVERRFTLPVAFRTQRY